VTGLRRFVAGEIVRPGVGADLPLRKLAAMAALAAEGGLDPAQLGSVAVEPDLWPTSALIDWWTVAARVPGIPQRAERLAEAERAVRDRLAYQGAALGFSSERTDDLGWLMVSPDVNAARLVLLLLETDGWHDEQPRLVRGLLARQRRGTWSSTVASAWGVLAVERFAAAFEKSPVTGVSTVSLGPATERVAWSAPPAGTSVTLPWPSAPADLLLRHSGRGSPWFTIEARAALPLGAPLWSGYELTRTVTPVDPRAADRLSVGDVVRVRLDVEAQNDTAWVVVTDPIPAGASHVKALAGQEVGAGPDVAPPAFVERTFEAYRAYYEYVPRGKLVVEYAIRLNQSGRFGLPATRVEAIYEPEAFGELPNATVEVSP
jgi:uncharacterized protein YfaS (alpha-2-macroglobulin family)